MTIEGGPALPIVISQDAPDGSLSALPVWGTLDLPPSDRAMQGGPALPVKVLLDSDLVQNGGQYRLEGRPQALPVYLAPVDTPVIGQRPVPVYPLNRNIWYRDRLRSLFGSSIIGYWPMNEPSGLVAYDYSGNGYHGAYTGVTLGQPGIGDGRTCALFDGANDYMQPPAGFRTAFNNQEGTIACWVKMLNVGVWTDAVNRYMFRIGVDGNNFVSLFKNSVNNNLSSDYRAGGTVKQISVAGNSDVDWFHFAMTWSKSADQMILYKKGAQIGSTLTGLGVWAGTPVANLTIVGCSNTTGPLNVTSGGLQHAIVLNRTATPAEMAAAATI